jgi:hypothetical protein
MAAMSWSLEPDTWNLVDSEGKAEFSASEFVQRERPPCPVCGTPIIIDAISNLSLDDRESVMPARCYCPNGHTPRDQQEQA